MLAAGIQEVFGEILGETFGFGGGADGLADDVVLALEVADEGADGYVGTGDFGVGADGGVATTLHRG